MQMQKILRDIKFIGNERLIFEHTPELKSGRLKHKVFLFSGVFFEYSYIRKVPESVLII